MSYRHLVAAFVVSIAPVISSGSFAQAVAYSPMSFAEQLAQTKAQARTFNSATLDRTERFEVDKYIAQAESLYRLGSDKKAQEFLDVARGRLRLPIMRGDMRLAANVKDHLRPTH